MCCIITTTFSQINRVEYFIDTDPGMGNGIPITINTPSYSINESFSVDTSTLNTGIHTLYVRTEDVNDVWSLYFKQTFLVHDFSNSTSPSQIIAAEYFFDTDPGTNNGTAIAITPGFSVSESLAITAALSDGIHTLYVRTKDNDDRWSIYFKQTFLVHTFSSPVQTQINKAEYFFDTDPGVGNGTDVPITSGFSLNESVSISSSSLAEGTHYLYIRTRDEAGNWSLYEVLEFEVTETLGIEDNIILVTRIYPVPAINEITIDSEIGDIENITLFDLRGKEINSFEANSSIITIDVSNYASGTYILQIKNDKGILNKKIVIK